MNLEKQIDQFLTVLMQFAENKHEILIGKCESDIKLTSTQEHILMLLMGPTTTSTNAKMADELKISPAAVTKALKKLQELQLINSARDKNDERVIMWRLTNQGLPLAQEHAKHHAKTLEAYQELAQSFNSSEQEVIERFLTKLTGEFL